MSSDHLSIAKIDCINNSVKLLSIQFSGLGTIFSAI